MREKILYSLSLGSKPLNQNSQLPSTVFHQCVLSIPSSTTAPKQRKMLLGRYLGKGDKVKPSSQLYQQPHQPLQIHLAPIA